MMTLTSRKAPSAFSGKAQARRSKRQCLGRSSLVPISPVQGHGAEVNEEACVPRPAVGSLCLVSVACFSVLSLWLVSLSCLCGLFLCLVFVACPSLLSLSCYIFLLPLYLVSREQQVKLDTCANGGQLLVRAIHSDDELWTTVLHYQHLLVDDKV